MYKVIGADGGEYGPVSLAQLRQWFAEGRVNARTRVLAGGSTNWKTLGELPEFALPQAQTKLPQPIRPLPGPAVSGRPPQTSGFAVTGLILGIISMVISFCCCGGMPFNLLGVIFSGMALAQINRQPDLYTGRETAVAGLIISGLSLLLGFGVMTLRMALNRHEIFREFHRF
jgi:hypothetical protein